MLGCVALPSPVRPVTTRSGDAAAAVADCERYRDTIPLARERCLITAARTLPGVEEMTAACSPTGPLIAECHAQWVDMRRRRDDLSATTLVAACAPSDDCALQILDNYHPVLEVIAQMARCDAAGRYHGTCVAHAMRRWAEAGPDGADIERVLAAQGPYPDVVGRAVGMIVACRGVGACPDGGTPLAAACLREEQAARKDPGRCYTATGVRTSRPPTPPPRL